MATEPPAPLPVSVCGVVRDFGAHSVLGGVDLEVAAGEVLAVLGPSGGGKSTLLRLVAGLDRPTAGRVLVGGEPVSGPHRRAAVVFQDARLLPWRTLAANVALGLPRGTPRARRGREVEHWLGVVGLAGAARHRPSQVSGGMAQRAALARALARRPGVLLLDEPFAALDALTRLRMQELLDRVRRAAGTTVLLVTHDVDEALRLADRVAVLGHGPAARVAAVLDLPVHGPRATGDPRLTPLRADLLRRLGVPQRHAPEKEPRP
ncbi:ABC transporter ATP-binding protein [Streptomyces sp. NPDC005805]|uniref:ABC transporter ATP-binding protein n=1 Tax=Streptomyces sp. NPDC005805 TaxID=3157068 RepID=UPI0033D31A24